MAGGVLRDSGKITEAVPVCEKLHRNESGESRALRDLVGLAMVNGPWHVALLRGSALANELREGLRFRRGGARLPLCDPGRKAIGWRRATWEVVLRNGRAPSRRRFRTG